MSCEKPIKLVSSEGDVFEIPRTYLRFSEVLADLMEENVECPLDLCSAILQKVIVWMDYHQNDEISYDVQPLKSFRLDDAGLCEFDYTYIRDLDTEQVYQLAMAADFLGVHGLLVLCGARVTSMLEGYTRDEVEMLLGTKPCDDPLDGRFGHVE